MVVLCNILIYNLLLLFAEKLVNLLAVSPLLQVKAIGIACPIPVLFTEKTPFTKNI